MGFWAGGADETKLLLRSMCGTGRFLWGTCSRVLQACAKCHVMWEGNKNEIPGTRMSVQAVNQTRSLVEVFHFTWDWLSRV